MQTERPNILFLIAEDLGKHLGCYGLPYVQTPNLDRLAAEGVRFENAFCTAPVCSPARSAVITGMYQTTIGCHHHRSHRDDGYVLPPPVQPFTRMLKEAGYFCCNGAHYVPNGPGKTDFNFNDPDIWDGWHYSQRAKGQPFFMMMNFIEVHRGPAWREEPPAGSPRVDQRAVRVPKYYPDHPIVRKDLANYHESANVLDQKVGEVLAQLERDGLKDNTIIVFYGDNGACLLRCKQWLYDGGISVPMIVRYPDGRAAGTVNRSLVSLIDLAPTVLHWAGLRPPKWMQGVPFDGPRARRRDMVFAARDRCDETVDWIRCCRDHRFKYIRNYLPDRPYTQPNAYIEEWYPILGLLRELNAQNRLTPEQAAFLAPVRPAEELYDLQRDPDEVHNLASDPRYQSTLRRMRTRLERWRRETDDKGNGVG